MNPMNIITWIELQIDLRTRRIVAIRHQWDRCISDGYMSPTSLVNPDVHNEDFLECFGCCGFNTCYVSMVWTGIDAKN